MDDGYEDDSYIREFADSGLENSRLCLRLNQECKTFLDTDPSAGEYEAWLTARGSSPRVAARSARNLPRVREIVERKLRTIPIAIEMLELCWDDGVARLYPSPSN